MKATETTDDDLSWVQYGTKIIYEQDGQQMLAAVGDVEELKRAVQAKAISNVRPFPP